MVVVFKSKSILSQRDDIKISHYSYLAHLSVTQFALYLKKYIRISISFIEDFYPLISLLDYQYAQNTFNDLGKHCFNNEKNAKKKKEDEKLGNSQWCLIRTPHNYPLSIKNPYFQNKKMANIVFHMKIVYTPESLVQQGQALRY